MASLVAPLVSGISTAASGSVEFFLQGTSTLAAAYSDAEGEVQQTAHTLDARGAIVRYVEGRVTVLVRDSGGAEVVQFVWGTDARDARVENLGFTGPDASGQIVAGGRQTVDGALTKLFESLGTTDGNVLVNGIVTTLTLALSSSAGLVYNVKSGYGAVGDGTADDSGAVQDAINAATNAGGGIIYFPHGTYRFNSGVVAATGGAGKLIYLGEGALASTIRQGASGITGLALGSGNDNIVLGLAFEASNAANTGNLVSVGNEARACFIGCAFADHAGLQISGVSSSEVTCVHCNFTISSSAATVTSASARFLSCDFDIGAGTTAFNTSALDLSFQGCSVVLGSGGGASGTVAFLSSAITFATFSGGQIENHFASGSVTLGANEDISLTGVGISSQGGATLTLAGTATHLHEAGCAFLTIPSTYALGGDEDSNSTHRERRATSTSGSATSYTPDGSYAIHHVISDGASMAFANPSPNVWTGSGLLILYKNATTGGGAVNITPTFGTAYSFTTAVGVVNAGNTGVYFFVPRQRGGGVATVTTDLINISPQAATGYTL